MDPSSPKGYNMSKSVIARLFYGSLLAIVLAIALLGIVAVIAIASSSFTTDGPDVVGISSAFGWGVVVVAVLTILVITVGSIAQLVAWIGALINTAPLESKTWFVVLLIAGVLGFGVIAMLVYLLSESDAERAPTSR